MDKGTFILLILSGLTVGFINTIAAGATMISITVFMLVGLPVNLANGTNRVAVLLQNIVATISFRKQKIVDLSVGLRLGIPVIIGTIIGAQVASDIRADIFQFALGGVLLLLMFFLIFSPDRWLDGSGELRPIRPQHYVWYFLMGVYGGSLHVGVGYFLLAVSVMGLGYDLVRANALKNLLVMLYTPFALAVFIINGQVNFEYGLVHGIGNIVGAYFAAKYASRMGVRFIKWFMILVMFFIVLYLFGMIDLRELFSAFLDGTM